MTTTSPQAAPETPTAPSPSSDEGRGRLRRAAVALFAVSAICAGWFGWAWVGAAGDEGLGYSRLREEVLRSGTQAVQNMNTLSHRSVERDLALWEDSTAAQLHQQIVQGRGTFAAEIAKAGTTTTAKVMEAALTELDAAAGTARIIAAVRITVIPPQGEPAVKKSRLVGELTRTAGGWKLSALTQAPDGTTS
ncbi:hypothetical protein [Nonomuraea typhae]|uniref:hypothetical protein n=1 Tax=Nonomuraea typhae TaxID=2603600 RepID=UPI001CA4C9DB|nr:hypothetical protein [Nonomuraea typhae]